MCVAIARRSCDHGVGPHCARHWQIQSKTMVSAPKTLQCKHWTRGNRWRQTQTGKLTGRARRSCKGFCVGVLTQSSLLRMSKVIQEFTGLHSLGLGPKSCRPCDGGRYIQLHAVPQISFRQGLGAGRQAYLRAPTRSAGVPVSRGSWVLGGNQRMKERVSVDGFAELSPQNAHM